MSMMLPSQVIKETPIHSVLWRHCLIIRAQQLMYVIPQPLMSRHQTICPLKTTLRLIAIRHLQSSLVPDRQGHTVRKYSSTVAVLHRRLHLQLHLHHWSAVRN